MMDNRYAAYIFGDLICVLMLAIISRNSKKQFKVLLAERFFLEIILSSIIFLLSDIVWTLVEGIDAPFFRSINILASSIYLYMTGLIGFIWIVYVDFKVKRKLDISFRKRVTVYSIPMVVLLVVTLLSHKNHLLFYVDENNVYHRGPFHSIQVVIGILYIVWAAGVTIVGMNKQKVKHKKDELRGLLQFAIFPLLGGILQLIVPNLPFTTVGVSLAILLVYISVQNKQVSIDTLTGINNRRQLSLYIDSAMSESNRKGDLYYLIMDIDKFKLINDTYGHIEGDNALVKVAQILTSVCDKNNDFVARYGGDEFAIVCRRKTDAEVEALKNDIEGAIKKVNDSGELSYKLSLSIGSAKFTSSGESRDEILAQADKKLYSIKASK